MENLATIAAIAGGALYFLTRKKTDTATTTSTPAQSTVLVAADAPAVAPVLAAPRIVVQVDSRQMPRLSRHQAYIMVDGVSYLIPMARFASLARLIQPDHGGMLSGVPSAALMTADLDAMVAQQGLDATVIALKAAGMTEAEAIAAYEASMRFATPVGPNAFGPQPVMTRSKIASTTTAPSTVTYIPTGLAPTTTPSLSLSATKLVPITQVKTYTVPTAQTVQTSPKTTYSTPTVQTVYSAPSLAYTPTKTATTSTLSIKPTTSTNLTYRVG